ncbi:unnamed protein product [Brassicogethes aeneus]|uniref:Protein FAM177A1 n=1 Tax=Brassicogethes aeneus TaxID=1431903 RepID=A0A9P0FL65_BRAAE|nr:unnamed protein product [Brassicogethes aeneus]
MVLVDPETRNIAGIPGTATNVRVKEPKRILHFSDGVLEEYSSDEDEVDAANNNTEQAIVDPATLTWGPWFVYKAWTAGSNTLYALDKSGEFLASMFGITTPKYYFELEEYKRRQEQLKLRQEQGEGWSEPSTVVPLNEISTKQPEPAQGEV